VNNEENSVINSVQKCLIVQKIRRHDLTEHVLKRYPSSNRGFGTHSIDIYVQLISQFKLYSYYNNYDYNYVINKYI